MATVNFQVNGRAYALGCDDGEEERLTRLGQRLDARVRGLADQFGQLGDQRLLLMSAIALLDEQDELLGQIEARAESLVGAVEADAEQRVREAEDSQAAARELLERLAERAEALVGSAVGTQDR